jgi:Ca2+-binding RTX toxin-like protein
MPTIQEMMTNLESLIQAIPKDPGLKAQTPMSEIRAGMVASRALNELYTNIISERGFNDDHVIRPEEVFVLSDVVHTTPLLYVSLIANHGDDENGDIETGFHYVQKDGGTMMFRGRAFLDTVADAIYHVGFAYSNGRFVNEDGTANETGADIAGWLNYFLNGKSMVFGTSAGETLGTGKYDAIFKGANNEIFDAGAGNDYVWAGPGHDKVLAGSGNDEAGGGTGSDRIYGGAGSDKLWGETGNDKIFGEAGNDRLGGGKDNDTLDGGAGDDEMSGDEGNDVLVGGNGNDKISTGAGVNTADGGAGDDDIYCGDQADKADGSTGNDIINGNGGYDRIHGDEGNDKLSGGNGNDIIYGGAGKDELNGGEGRDLINAGAGADKIEVWDGGSATDTIVFAAGDSGRLPGTIDIVSNFTSGEDKIDLRKLGDLTLTSMDFIGGGRGSVYYDGHYLRIDTDGDRAADMLIEFTWLNKLVSNDLLLA